MDIGAGNGYTSACAFKEGFNMCTIEPSYSACKHSKNRGIPTVLCGIVSEETIVDYSIGQAIMLDCLEHIENDTYMLHLLNKKIKKGGVLLITVPAFMGLWSSEDDSAGHFRRYTCKELETKVKDAGFEVLGSTYFMSFLYFPILLFRVALEKIGLIKKTNERNKEDNDTIVKKQFISSNDLINNVLAWIENKEKRRIQKGKKLPLGSSIILVAINE